MPAVSYITVYPSTGYPDRRWEGSAVKDAFARRSRAVCEIYTSVIRPLKLAAFSSEVRLVMLDERSVERFDEIQIRVARKFHPPCEFSWVAVPRAYLGLTATAQAERALQAVHLTMLTLAETRGWDESILVTASKHVRESNYEYLWSGVWKAAPSRRHEARASFRLTPEDGFGRAWLEIRDRNSHEVVARSVETVAFCTFAGFTRSANSLRWVSSIEVEFVPYIGIVGPRGRVVDLRVDGEVTMSRDGYEPKPRAPSYLVHEAPAGSLPVKIERRLGGKIGNDIDP